MNFSLETLEGNNIFSNNLEYEDLKVAHTETLIPVTNDDFNNIKKYKNIGELKKERNSQIFEPINKEKSMNILNTNENKSIEEGVKMAYKMFKQDELIKKREAQAFKNLKQIKNL